MDLTAPYVAAIGASLGALFRECDPLARDQGPWWAHRRTRRWTMGVFEWVGEYPITDFGQVGNDHGRPIGPIGLRNTPDWALLEKSYGDYLLDSVFPENRAMALVIVDAVETAYGHSPFPQLRGKFYRPDGGDPRYLINLFERAYWGTSYLNPEHLPPLEGAAYEEARAAREVVRANREALLRWTGNAQIILRRPETLATALQAEAEETDGLEWLRWRNYEPVSPVDKYFVFVNDAKPAHILKREEGRGGERFRHFITRGGGRWSKRSFGANDGELRPATPDEVFRMRRGAAPVEAWERLPQPTVGRWSSSGTASAPSSLGVYVEIVIGEVAHTIRAHGAWRSEFGEAPRDVVQAAARTFAESFEFKDGSKLGPYGIHKYIERALRIAISARRTAKRAAETQAKKDAEAAKNVLEAQAKKDAEKAAALARKREIEAMPLPDRSLARAIDAVMPIHSACEREQARATWRRALEMSTEDYLWSEPPPLFGNDERSTPKFVAGIVRDAFDRLPLSPPLHRPYAETTLAATYGPGKAFVAAVGLHRVQPGDVEEITRRVEDLGGCCKWQVTVEHGHLCLLILIKSNSSNLQSSATML